VEDGGMSVTASEIASADAIAVVLTAGVLNEAVNDVASLGGGWRVGVETWRAMRVMPHAILIAPNKFRIKRRAPLLLAARNLQGLEEAARRACSLLDDVLCAWIKLGDSEANAVVEREMLRDSTIGGRA
jgi:hypothetical protein